MHCDYKQILLSSSTITLISVSSPPSVPSIFVWAVCSYLEECARDESITCIQYVSVAGKEERYKSCTRDDQLIYIRQSVHHLLHHSSRDALERLGCGALLFRFDARYTNTFLDSANNSHRFAINNENSICGATAADRASNKRNDSPSPPHPSTLFSPRSSGPHLSTGAKLSSRRTSSTSSSPRNSYSVLKMYLEIYDSIFQ